MRLLLLILRLAKLAGCHQQWAGLPAEYFLIKFQIAIMLKQASTVILLLLVFSFFSQELLAQLVDEKKDTFFLAKKKGLLGKLGKSLNTDGAAPDEIKMVNPYIIYSGKIIRNIEILRLGFERNINDTTLIKNNFGTIVANGLHRSTKQ